MSLEKGKVDMMEQLTTQQMERIAMLQLRNQIWMVALIIWGCLLLLILLLCALQFYLDLRRRARQSSDTLTLTCDHCSRSFPVPLAHFYRHPFLLKKRVRIQAGIAYSIIQSYRMQCPHCHRKSWCTLSAEDSRSLAASLLKGIWHRHLLRFLLLEGAVFIFGLLCLFLIRTLLTP